MKNTDAVMKELWLAKQSIVKRHKNIAQYVAFLRKRGKREHPGGRIPAPPPPKATGTAGRSR